MYASSHKNTSILLDDWDHEIDTNPPFIGRENDLRLLQEAFQTNTYTLFGVFGIRSVGKSRLMQEFLSRYVGKCNCDKYTTNGDAESSSTVGKSANLNEQQTDTESMYSNMCACIGESPELNNTDNKTWILQIIKYVKDCKRQQFIFFFDNVEHAEDNSEMANSINLFFWQLTSECMNSRVFITSTTQFMTSRLQPACFSHELRPLRPTESAKLLRVIAPEVDLGEYKDVIVKLSEGLPLLLSMIANELADDKGLITPKDMAELLATSRLQYLSRRDFYAEEDRIADVYKKFIERLHTMYRHRLSVLGYIPGSFDVREAKEILDESSCVVFLTYSQSVIIQALTTSPQLARVLNHLAPFAQRKIRQILGSDQLGFDTDAEAEQQALIPIRSRYLLTYDPETKRFNIQGIIRDCLDVFFAIKNIADVRKKFCSVFSAVMTDIAEDLGTAETARALARFSLEQPNFQKLMTEVYHTTEDTYRCFITMATKCTDLIERFLLKDCGKFYDGCLVMAGRYGDDVDTAVVSIAVGSMWTNAKGDLRRGEKYYRDALKVLVPNGSRLHQATIYHRLGWNLYSQGLSLDALRYFRESLNICHRGGQELHLLHRQSLSGLGIASTLLGKYQDAENYHFMSLRRAETMLTDDHPELGFIYNSLGIFYNELGQSENALKYFLKGLENRKKNNAPENALNLSHSNIANQYNKLQKDDEAINMLNESIELALKRDPPLKTVLALLYDTKGKVFMEQKKYIEAMDMYEKAVEIREVLVPDNIVFVESLVHLADVERRLEHYESSIKTARKALKLKTKAEERMPLNPFIAECYQCLAEVYERVGNHSKLLQTLARLKKELLRLEDLHIDVFNAKKLTWVRKQLDDVNDKLERFTQSSTEPLYTDV